MFQALVWNLDLRKKMQLSWTMFNSESFNDNACQIVHTHFMGLISSSNVTKYSSNKNANHVDIA